MTNIANHITLYSEDGEPNVNNQLDIKLVHNDPNCPYTFYAEEKPVFSLGSEEIPDLIKFLQSLELNP